jgi:hypothetical protein
VISSMDSICSRMSSSSSGLSWRPNINSMGITISLTAPPALPAPAV